MLKKSIIIAIAALALAASRSRSRCPPAAQTAGLNAHVQKFDVPAGDVKCDGLHRMPPISMSTHTLPARRWITSSKARGIW